MPPSVFRAFAGAAFAFSIGAAGSLPSPSAVAQEAASGRPALRDLVIGEPFAAQPQGFQEFACGTDGGPPSLRIGGFGDFATCPPEATGLHEVQFRYDDELYYLALTQRNALRARAFEGTRIGNFHVVVSALFDDDGILRGVRAVTDDRVPDKQRRSSYALAEFVRSIYGSEGWECADIPPAAGENPLADRLVKEDCRKLTDDGFVITTRSRLLRREGQTLVDPANGQLRPGLFEATGRMEMYAADASGDPVYGNTGGVAAAATAAAPVPSDPVAAFLAGVIRDCPGCDLAGADLKRRDLAGADLRGADLSGATLHRALLGGARLDGAILRRANLNVADLRRTSLAGADLAGALLYEADAGAADFSGAVLDNANIERARLTSARMSGLHATRMYGLAARLAGADLTGAVLTGTVFYEADFQRAILAEADLTDTSFYRAVLRSADLSGASAVRADFLEADLSSADFGGADLSGARLLRARVGGIDLTGATTEGATMADGRPGG